MIIPINFPDPSTAGDKPTFPPQLAKLGTNEVILLELQGSIQTEGNADGQLVGTLKIDEKTDKPTLMIGFHLLEGKIVNLPKPLAVLKKRATTSQQNGQGGLEDSMDVDDEGKPADASPAKAPEYDVLAVVKRKVLFSKRPMPIMASSMAKGTAEGKTVK